MTDNTVETTIQQDVVLDRDDATTAFLKGWEDAAEPSEEPEEEAPEEPEETEAPEDESDEEAVEEEDSEDPQDDEEPDSALLKDDATVKVTVDGEELEVSVKDLKRLYGQEASLTKKSQAVAETQKKLVQAQEYVESTLELMLAQAEEAIEPYKNIDWVVASKRLTEEELTALRDEAQKAYAGYQKVTNKVDEYVKTKREEHSAQLQELITQAHEELSDPEKGIPEWGKQKYSELSAYAQSLGFPKEAIDSFVTAPVWHLLHKAYQYDKGKQVATKKVNKTPKKTMKSTKRTETSTKNSRAKEALRRMQETGGSRDSAADAFLSMWQK
jgi:hypothetical protein